MFACVCVQKSVELGSDRKMHRSVKEQQLREEVQQLLIITPAPGDACADLFSSGPTCAFQPGGGMRVDGTDTALSLASLDTCVAVFKGQLLNAANLALKCAGEGDAVSTRTPAEIVCGLYTAFGVDMLPLLRGTFSFCLYESKTARVLAASDASGAVSLYEGRTPSGDLIVASSREYLAACTEVVKFQPGDYKFGWHSVHRRYNPTDFASDSHGRHQGRDGVHPEHPHHGLGHGSTMRCRRNSDPTHHQSGRSPPTGAAQFGRSLPGRNGGAQRSAAPRTPPPSDRRTPSKRAASSASKGSGKGAGGPSAQGPSSRLEGFSLPSAGDTVSMSTSGASTPPLVSSGRSLDPNALPYTPPASAAAVVPTGAAAVEVVSAPPERSKAYRAAAPASGKKRASWVVKDVASGGSAGGGLHTQVHHLVLV